MKEYVRRAGAVNGGIVKDNGCVGRTGIASTGRDSRTIAVYGSAVKGYSGMNVRLSGAENGRRGAVPEIEGTVVKVESTDTEIKEGSSLNRGKYNVIKGNVSVSKADQAGGSGGCGIITLNSIGRRGAAVDNKGGVCGAQIKAGLLTA